MKLIRSHFEKGLSAFFLYSFAALALTLSVVFVGASALSKVSVVSEAVTIDARSSIENVSPPSAMTGAASGVSQRAEPPVWLEWLKSQGVNSSQLSLLAQSSNLRDVNLANIQVSGGRKLLLLGAEELKYTKVAANDQQRFFLASGDALYLWSPAYIVEQFDFQNSREEIRQLQADLNRLNVYSGAQDGLIGPQTIRAIAAFQQTQGRPQSGALDNLTLFLIQNINVVKL